MTLYPEGNVGDLISSQSIRVKTIFPTDSNILVSFYLVMMARETADKVVFEKLNKTHINRI